MAETVNIILEFLRQNKFMKAEAALRLELLARQGSTESIFLNPRDLDLLLEPANDEATPYSDKIFPEDDSFCKVAFDSWSKGPSDRLTASDLKLKGWEAESASCNEVSPTFAMQQNLMCERSEWDSYGLESTSLPSATFTCGETRPSYGIVGGPRIKDLESGISTHTPRSQWSRVSTSGVVPRGQKDQIAEEASGTIGRITGVQNEKGEFQIKHENSTPKFIQRDPLETHTQRVDCVVDYITKAGSLCKPCDQASNEKIGMLRWERDCTIDSHGQQETLAYQPEKSPIVYESGDFSVQNVLFPEFLENHCDSFARVSYGDSTENGWFNHCIPSATYSKPSSNGILTDSSQPFSLSCPMIGDSMDQYEQNEKKQVAYDLEGQSRPVDFLKDISVPWEVVFQNDNVQLGDFEEGKASTDKSRWKGFPKPPHVKIRSIETDLHLLQESNGSFHFDSVLDGGHHGITNAVSEPSFSLGSFLDIPVGQDTPLSGVKWQNGSSRLSVSQSIVEDTPELLSGFATLVHEPGDSGVSYPQEYWESDAYEDDEDPGYHRQLIEDEAWFLANEIDYPSDDDKAKSSKAASSPFPNRQDNNEYENFSEAEDESYFSREQFDKVDHNEPQTSSGHEAAKMLSLFVKSSQCNFVERSPMATMSYNDQLMDGEELKLVRTQHILQEFGSEINQIDAFAGEKNFQVGGKCYEEFSSEIDSNRHGSMRSIGAGICSDVAGLGSRAKYGMLATYSEWGRESLDEPKENGCQTSQMMLGQDNILCRIGNDAARGYDDFGGDSAVTRSCLSSDCISNSFCVKKQTAFSSGSRLLKFSDGHPYEQIQEVGCGTGFDRFSFQCPLSTDDLTASVINSRKSVRITENRLFTEDTDVNGRGIFRPEETVGSWKQKSKESRPVSTQRVEAVLNTVSSVKSSGSSHSTYAPFLSATRSEKYDASGYGEEEALIDDEETAALEKQFQQLKVEEDEYEIFNLRIVHRKNRTGFEEEKNFPVVINSVVAGRYLVTEYLGSAAFSKAIQARDLQTGMDVCMKIIKNNKDFFDQSLDEIKLLKFVNKHDPADKYHILRLYDYFYYQEHLFIVCELLRANLYEFNKFNRESGGEMYFTMARLQSITKQCLEALEFLHGLGLIHCDLKPENILVKSYSRCEIKVIDLGSSCFQFDHLSPYVQSRAYRAPEVILGLLYNQKIDIWSLGCILAELCSGHVLFQNDSIATLLARVFGIIGPVNPEILAKGRDTHKYFTKNYMLYERNQETNQLEYLLPKKTSLRHRLPMGDQGFVDFIGYLLQIYPENRPTASEALKHPWLSYPYEPSSS